MLGSLRLGHNKSKRDNRHQNCRNTKPTKILHRLNLPGLSWDKNKKATEVVVPTQAEINL